MKFFIKSSGGKLSKKSIKKEGGENYLISIKENSLKIGGGVILENTVDVLGERTKIFLKSCSENYLGGVSSIFASVILQLRFL